MKKFLNLFLLAVFVFTACRQMPKPTRPEPQVQSALIAKDKNSNYILYVFGENLGYVTRDEMMTLTVANGEVGTGEIFSKQTDKYIRATYICPTDTSLESEIITVMNKSFTVALNDFIIDIVDGTVTLLDGGTLPTDGAITIPDGVETINESVFEGCTTLTQVTFPETLTEINFESFSGCTGLKEVDLSNTKVIRIKAYGFGDCESIETVKLPQTLQYIGIEAFCVMGGGSLQSIEFADKQNWIFCPTDIYRKYGGDEGIIQLMLKTSELTTDETNDIAQINLLLENDLEASNVAKELASLSGWGGNGYLLKLPTTTH